MLQLLLLLASVALALAGRSPHADFIEATFGSGTGRYSCNILEDAKLDVVGLATKYGYPIETHVAPTADDYILTMHRIPHGRDRNNLPYPNKPIVFLMHGLLSSSADWLLMGPGNALAYLLAEEGYDVWMGNARGNFYSRSHRRLNPDRHQNFWRFSWDEIGNLDLPAMLDYIERYTGQSRLHYIGHSQGGTAFLVLTSLRPEYNKRFISFQGYAPASYFTHNEHPTFTALAPYEHVLEPAVFAMGRAEVFGNREFITWFATNLCYGGSVMETMCHSVMARDTDYFNQTMVPLKLGHTPAGASIRQFTHYGQSIKFDTFRRFNFNTLTNLQVYGSRTPPDYDMSRITTPTYLHYAHNDILVHPLDVEKLASKLPNLQLLNKLESRTFDHVDFIWGKGAKQVLYLKTIFLMRQAELKFGRT